jgi:hypothetical protein
MKDDDIRAFQRFHRAHRQQARIAGARADKDDAPARVRIEQ